MGQLLRKQAYIVQLRMSPSPDRTRLIYSTKKATCVAMWLCWPAIKPHYNLFAPSLSCPLFGAKPQCPITLSDRILAALKT